jgi:hypothetical protein
MEVAMTLSKRNTWWTALMVVLAMAIPGVAYAHEGDDEAAEAVAVSDETETDETAEDEEPEVAETPVVLSTLPVLGSGLNLTINRDENGAIASVALDPSDGTTVLKEGEHKVVILLADGDTEVTVKSKEGVVQTKVKADAPADVAGDGVWSGDVFGTGEVSVPYSVSFEGNVPTITVGTVSAPADVVSEIGEGKAKASDDGDRAYYSVKVELTSGENEAVLKLKASTKVDDDGETRVVVSATLHSDDKVDCGFGDRRDDDRRDKDRDDDDESEARASRVSDDNRDRDWDDEDDERDRGDDDDRDRDDDDDDDERDRDRDRDDDDDRDRDDS